MQMPFALSLSIFGDLFKAFRETADRVDVAVNDDLGTIGGCFECERALRHDVTPNYI
jgi:hypothetical protein